MRIQVNGTTLFFDTEGSHLEQQGTRFRERPTVVAVHGGPGVDHAMYRPVLSPLTKVAQIIYLDLRGNGRSDWGTPQHWNLATWAEDLRAFCDALEIRQPVVLGTSFGGFVAQAYATRFPEHPGKLILCSTNPRFNLARALAMFERRGGPEAAEVARRFFADPTTEIFQQYVQVCLPLYSRLPVKSVSPGSIIHLDLARYFVGGEWRTFDFTQELARIRCPTLVLAGEHDPVLPREGADELVAALRPELVRYEVFPECAHNVLTEAPEQALAVMEEFIRGSGARPR